MASGPAGTTGNCEGFAWDLLGHNWKAQGVNHTHKIKRQQVKDEKGAPVRGKFIVTKKTQKDYDSQAIESCYLIKDDKNRYADLPRDEVLTCDRWNVLCGKHDDYLKEDFGTDIKPRVWDLEVYQLINDAEE